MRFHDQIIIHFIMFFTLVIALASTSSAPYNFPVAKPGCQDRCGDVSIPFPFGMMTPGCYLNDEFLITCNKSSNPPKPLLETSSNEIKGISLDGQLTLLNYISHDCYSTLNSTSSFDNSISLSKFTINSTANKIIFIGCDTLGLVLGSRHNSDYETQTGCIAMCDRADDLVQGACAGTGCCQIPIPDDVWSVYLSLGSLSNYSKVSGVGNCSYAFVVEESAYTFSPDNLTKLMDISTKMPMVANWAIGNGTNCEKTQMDASSYACKGVNATCLDKKTGNETNEYRCSCKEGYQGNPYLEGGCQDIDECLDTSLNDCEKNYCVNRAGDFYCSTCPKGYHGDRKRDGKGCTRSESRSYKLEAG